MSLIAYMADRLAISTVRYRKFQYGKCARADKINCVAHDIMSTRHGVFPSGSREPMTTISYETEPEHERVIPVRPANWVPGPRQGNWTYEAYAALPEDGKRYEVVQGVLMMSPAPETAHQGVIAEIYAFLREQVFLKRRGLVLTSPVDVVLAKKTTVQPDVLVVLAEHVNRVEQKRVVGTPDLIVEVISPGSATYDRLVKYSVYEQSGVPEYWLVNLPEQTIEIFILENGGYRLLGSFTGEQVVQSRLIPDASAPAAQFFAWTGGLL